MALDIYEYYERLEPNHEVRVDDDGMQFVRCPFIDAETPWSPHAGSEEVGCEFCDALIRMDDPEHPGHEDHGCEDGEGDPPIIGGAHGPTHRWDEYASCKVPLRRINVFDIFITVHEGIAGDCFEADRRWRAKGGKEWFIIRQGDTGSYNCRPSAGHSRGVACDFNWNSNPYRKPKPAGGCPQQPRMREFYEVCWKPLGYGWGGLWNSACDAMHVSKVPSEGGDGILYKTSQPEEDVMNAAQEKKLDDLLEAVGKRRFKNPDGKFAPDITAMLVESEKRKNDAGEDETWYLDGVKLIRNQLTAMSKAPVPDIDYDRLADAVASRLGADFATQVADLLAARLAE